MTYSMILYFGFHSCISDKFVTFFCELCEASLRILKTNFKHNLWKVSTYYQHVFKDSTPRTVPSTTTILSACTEENLWPDELSKRRSNIFLSHLLFLCRKKCMSCFACCRTSWTLVAYSCSNKFFDILKFCTRYLLVLKLLLSNSLLIVRHKQSLRLLSTNKHYRQYSARSEFIQEWLTIDQPIMTPSFFGQAR